MGHMKNPNFEPFVLNCLECDQYHKLVISTLACKECLLLILQRSINWYLR